MCMWIYIGFQFLEEQKFLNLDRIEPSLIQTTVECIVF